jgi:hypothetical protein
MSKMKEFVEEVDYLINVEMLDVDKVASMMGVTEEMVCDAICIMRDAHMETIH